jgi:phage terminase large subunit
MDQKQFKFLDAYYPLFDPDNPKNYYIISGGRASGKSTQVAAYFLVKLLQPDFFRGVISRYTLRSISNSIYRDILDLIDDWGLTSQLKITGEEIKNERNGNMIITHALKLTENSMSAKSKGLANCTHLLIDEAIEMEQESEYVKLIDSFRTNRGAERKIFLTFNPVSKSHWIFKRFYLPDGRPHPQWLEDHCFLHTTYKDSIAHLDPSKVREWERMAGIDPEYFRTQILGEWADIGEGQVFKTWYWDWKPDPEAETVYGVDFGFASDPSAVVKVMKRGQRIWVQEMVYERGLTTDALANHMIVAGIKETDQIVADSADPRSIETLRRLGFRNIRPSIKGADSIRSGIDMINSYQVFADPLSFNLRHEYDNYVYGPGTNKPIDSDNHLMDSIRYVISRNMKVGANTGYALEFGRGGSRGAVPDGTGMTSAFGFRF